MLMGHMALGLEVGVAPRWSVFQTDALTTFTNQAYMGGATGVEPA